MTSKRYLPLLAKRRPWTGYSGRELSCGIKPKVRSTGLRPYLNMHVPTAEMSSKNSC